MANDEKLSIDINLVKNLITTQFPQWAHLPIKPVQFSGWDNKTFHLGSDMSVRLPSHVDYALQVEKEQYWLPKLGPHLPFPIAMPITMGKPSPEYPLSWSIYQWLEGDTASLKRIDDLDKFGADLAHFLNALHQCDATKGPIAGEHNFYRGGNLSIYEGETREAIANLEDKTCAQKASEIWDLALSSSWKLNPVWVHGDFAKGNLLVHRGHLSAVIDFGQLGIGDPACDLVIAWTFLNAQGRDTFRETLKLDKATWQRARGWALWKALCWAFPGEKRVDWHVVNEIFQDHDRNKA